MIRPDHDKRLTSMGVGNATCDKCLMELYPSADDSPCEDCNLNPMKKGDATQFVEEAIRQESSLSKDEIMQRHSKMNKGR